MSQHFWVFIRVAIIVSCSSLLGCGQKGDLFLPADLSPETVSAAQSAGRNQAKATADISSTPDCGQCTAVTPEQDLPEEQEANSQ